jgi:hypothetical protein
MGIRLVGVGVFLCGCNAVADQGDSLAAASVLKAANAEPDADVTNVYAREEADGTWTFHVTVSHKDKGLNDFVDGWDLVTPSGTVLKLESHHRFTKVLRTPHVKEQPFTRTQRGIQVPEGIDAVRARAHDMRHGWGGQEVMVQLDRRFGPNFTVRRPR